MRSRTLLLQWTPVLLAGLIGSSIVIASASHGATSDPIWLDATRLGSVGSSALHRIGSEGSCVVFSSRDDLTGENVAENSQIFRWTSATGFEQLSDNNSSRGVGELAVDEDCSRVAATTRIDLAAVGAPATEVYLYEGSKPWRRVTTTAGEIPLVFQGGLSISEDGAQVSFQSRGDYAGMNASGELQIFRWSLAGGFEQITTATPCGSGGGNFLRDMSGDGSRIVFASRCDIDGSNPDLNSDLFLWEDDEGFTALTAGETEAISALTSMSRDGDVLALVSNDDLSNEGLSGYYLYRWTDAAGFERLSPTTVGRAFPSTNADGSWIAYEATDGQGTAANPEGSAEIFLWDVHRDRPFVITDSSQTDQGFGNERPRLAARAPMISLAALRAFQPPELPEGGIYVLSLPLLFNGTFDASVRGWLPCSFSSPGSSSCAWLSEDPVDPTRTGIMKLTNRINIPEPTSASGFIVKRCMPVEENVWQSFELEYRIAPGQTPQSSRAGSVSVAASFYPEPDCSGERLTLELPISREETGGWFHASGQRISPAGARGLAVEIGVTKSGPSSAEDPFAVHIDRVAVPEPANSMLAAAAIATLSWLSASLRLSRRSRRRHGSPGFR